MTRQQKKRLAGSGKPQIKMHVLGAAGAVTGSLNLFEYHEGTSVTRFLLDVGLTVENEAADFQNRLPNGLKASDIDFVIVSHAHLDHSGYLPKLVRDGFTGRAYLTQASADLLAIMLPDSGYLQEEAARHANKKAARMRASTASEEDATKPKNKRKPRLQKLREPLYTQEDAKRSLNNLAPLSYDIRHQLAVGIAVRFVQAGHILGAAVVNLEIGTGSHKRTFCFTGNVGRPHMPLLKDLAVVKSADYLMTESTYGNKLHLRRDRLEVLAGIIRGAYERALAPHKKFGHGVILIPAFAVGRAQTVLNDLRQLMSEKRIPAMPLFVDSPMTIRSTAVHRQHAQELNAETQALLRAGIDPFRTPNQTECMEREASMALDMPQTQPIIIVGSSGMASGGRIVQHLRARLPGKQNTVLFVGYQGTGTLGSALVGCRVNPAAGKCAEVVRIHGEEVNVTAKIEFMGDYSGHADYADLLAWMGKFTRRPQQTFVVHGEPEALEGLKSHIENKLQWNVTVPKVKETFILT
ncbi:MAG TPA: MBL fold metallo-hydrolase [Planktothrix sp.]